MNTRKNTIELGDISLQVLRKNIKNVHLSVHPPQGRVTISAPLSMDLETIRLFGISKLGWIRKQQARMRNQKREAPREYITRESHYYLGKRYLLKVIESKQASRVVLRHDKIEFYVRPKMKRKQKEFLLQFWYRQQLRKIIEPRIEKLEKKLHVRVADVGIRTMKTKWGTCNTKAKRIWLNTELAKKPLESIEYVLVHEMVHLLERKHNKRFIAYMDQFLPKWKYLRDALNRSALGHAEWSY